MWLADFQKGLLVLERIKKKVEYREKDCSWKCKFLNSSRSCSLFDKTLSKQWRRCDECIEIFGDKNVVSRLSKRIDVV